jgi:hypothetical protein
MTDDFWTTLVRELVHRLRGDEERGRPALRSADRDRRRIELVLRPTRVPPAFLVFEVPIELEQRHSAAGLAELMVTAWRNARDHLADAPETV